MRFLLITIVSAIWLQTLSAYLPSQIDKMMSKMKIRRENVSIKIVETKSGREIASYRSKQRRAPASVIKLMTTYSALLTLGTNFKWPTRFYYTGTLKRGVISGDLIVRSYGDPTLSSRDIPKIVSKMRRLGIRKIEGNIVIDRSFFAIGNKIVSGFDSNRYSEYNAMPDALMFNDHLCKIVVEPKGNRVKVYKSIPAPDYKVVNHLRVTNKRCVGKYSWPGVRIVSQNDIPTVTLIGTISNRCSPRQIRKVLNRAYYNFYYALISQMKRYGITVEGTLKLHRKPPYARALMTHYSRPLIDIVAKTNKKSNNLYARHIFLLVGTKIYGAPATLKKSRMAVRKILGKRGIIGSETILDNGCGLSRNARTNAEALTKLLQDAYKKFGHRWMNTLAIAGKDGTIRKRFRHSVAKGRAWMKTGTLNNAKNISGYVKGRSGKLYSVTILYNGPRRWMGSTLQNKIIEWLVRNR